MEITAAERQRIFNLYNVSEAARQLGLDVQRLHRDRRDRRVPSPEFRLGKRLYYTGHDLEKLSDYYKERNLT